MQLSVTMETYLARIPILIVAVQRPARAFSITSLDFAGHFMIKRGNPCKPTITSVYKSATNSKWTSLVTKQMKTHIVFTMALLKRLLPEEEI